MGVIISKWRKLETMVNLPRGGQPTNISYHLIQVLGIKNPDQQGL